MAARRTGQRSAWQRSAWQRIRPWRSTALTKAACVAAGAPSHASCRPGTPQSSGEPEQDKDAAQVASLARRFTALVRACGTGQPTRPAAPAAGLDTWLAKARACGIGAVETFAAGLEQDANAVRAAPAEPWSSGQAEGQVNRLKMLKRQSYGRASFDLSRRRALMPA